MTFNDAEYNSLRTELIHHDRTCLTILGLLLTASTAIYGLVVNKDLFYLLILLSVIWYVGFLYLVEKRSNIKRISFYIQIQAETEDSDLNWESWSRNYRYEINANHVFYLPSRSPLKLEYSLAIITLIVNCAWFCYLIFDKFKNEYNILIVILVIALAFTIPISYLSFIVYKYYRFNKSYKKLALLSQEDTSWSIPKTFKELANFTFDREDESDRPNKRISPD